MIQMLTFPPVSPDIVGGESNVRVLNFLIFISVISKVASADVCGDMEVMDFSSAMCQPLAIKGMPMSMAMLHFNSFFTQTHEDGPRGRDSFSVPDMFMADAGTSVGAASYVAVNFMGTFERWTYPSRGYPELLQIGEENENHQPYIDSQHPHSSPVMGITFSDTVTLGRGKDYFKLFFAPRGQATDGPQAFMHRPTGMVNPDAPLGHHIGQDAGHITSTVLGVAYHAADSTVEVSTFYGTEPEPTKVDLPVVTPNSYALRLTHEFNDNFYAMTSAALVKNPETHDLDLDHIWRYSASAYNSFGVTQNWTLQNTFIWGLVNDYDHIPALNSFLEEFLFRSEAKNIWGRWEYLQRTAGEIQVGVGKPGDPRWVSAVTLGYTHEIKKWDLVQMGLGASLTKDFLPADFQGDYGVDPLSAKVFLRVGGMKMWGMDEI